MILVSSGCLVGVPLTEEEKSVDTSGGSSRHSFALFRLFFGGGNSLYVAFRFEGTASYRAK